MVPILDNASLSAAVSFDMPNRLWFITLMSNAFEFEYVVYALEDELGIFYVGQTGSPGIRARDHRNRKYESRPHRFLILTTATSKLKARTLEVYWIRQLKRMGCRLDNKLSRLGLAIPKPLYALAKDPRFTFISTTEIAQYLGYAGSASFVKECIYPGNGRILVPCGQHYDEGPMIELVSLR